MAPGPDRAGGERSASGAQLLGDLLGDVGQIALEVVLLLSHLRQRGVLLAAAPWRAPSVRFWRFARVASSSCLARRDLVAGRADRVDGDLHLVAQAAHPGDDVVVLVLQRLQVLGPRQQVVEPVGLEQDGDQVRLVRLVDRDEPLLEDLDRQAETLLQVVEPRLRLLELGLLLGELRGDRRPPGSAARRPDSSAARAGRTRG